MIKEKYEQLCLARQIGEVRIIAIYKCWAQAKKEKLIVNLKIIKKD